MLDNGIGQKLVKIRNNKLLSNVSSEQILPIAVRLRGGSFTREFIRGDELVVDIPIRFEQLGELCGAALMQYERGTLHRQNDYDSSLHSFFAPVSAEEYISDGKINLFPMHIRRAAKSILYDRQS